MISLRSWLPAKNCWFALLIAAAICSSCVPGAFQPVNEGREYGDKVPIMVSHIPAKNGWKGRHYILKRILCFDYGCRLMISKQRAMKKISFEDFKKQIRKNARKGMYKKTVPVVPPKSIKPDSVKTTKVPEVIVAKEPVVPEEKPILQADSLIVLGESELLFEVNSFKLKGEHFAALDSVAKFLVANPTIEVIVSGHTDNSGTEHHNVALSTKRAEVVAEYLAYKGASFNKITYKGFGASKPIQPNATAKGRSKNRRVEILMRNPEGK